MSLALGTVQFGLPYGIANQSGQVPPEEIARILRRARSAGVDTLDTAIAYGNSEVRLGEAGVDGLRVVTKLPPLPDDLSDVDGWIRSQVAESCRRLGIDRPYGLLLHRALQLSGQRGAVVAATLQALKAEGKCDKIGVSIYAPEELGPVLDTCAIDLVQAPFNVVDRRLQTSGWLHRLHNAGIEIHTRSAFLQGLLLMPRQAMPARFERWSPLWDTWQAWLTARGMGATAACLGFVRQHKEIARVVVGVDSDRQFADLVAADAVTSADIHDMEWPAIASVDEMLVNPSQWNSL